MKIIFIFSLFCAMILSACNGDESSASAKENGYEEATNSAASPSIESANSSATVAGTSSSSPSMASSSMIQSSSSIPMMKECLTSVQYNEKISSWNDYVAINGINCTNNGYLLLTEDKKILITCKNGVWEPELIHACTEEEADARRSSSSIIPQSSSSLVAVSSSTVQASCHLFDKAPTVIGCEGRTKPNWKFLNPDVEYHCLIDDRDNQFYATVKIGEQTWMAENLAYADETKNPNLAGGHWCQPDADSCAIYGQLYNFMSMMDFDKDEMMDSELIKDSLFGKNWTNPHQGICPNGWHVPTIAEWMTLAKATGSTCDDETTTKHPTCTGGIFKLKSTCGWQYDSNGNEDQSTNTLGFSLLPVSNTYMSQTYPNGKRAYLWTSSARYCSECENNKALAYHIISTTGYNSLGVDDGTLLVRGRSLRCVKD